VQGAGVLKTLLDRKLITTAGRKDVVGKPIVYKTTKEFLIQFGLSSLNELPTLKEFEELGRLSLTDETSTAPESPKPGEADEAREMNSSEQRDDFEADNPATTTDYEVGVRAGNARPDSEIAEAEASDDNPGRTEPNG
jgi:segregation and condensation protein B